MHMKRNIHNNSTVNGKNPISHNAWVEIDLSILDNNIKELKKLLYPTTELCAVMKADAYGCGIDLCLPTIISNDIKYIGIGDNKEAKQVRELGFEHNIMRLRAATINEIKNSLNYQIVELIGSYKQAKTINDIGIKYCIQIPFNLALNSGQMSRNGLNMSNNNAIEEACKIIKLPNLAIKGIMTHYACDNKETIQKQLDDFKYSAFRIMDEAKLNYNDVKLHTANSYSALHMPETQLDIVRIGDALYENMGTKFSQFNDVFSLKTKVASIMEYSKGTPVGYKNKFVLKRNSKLANLAIGFSNGYLKAFKNKGRVIINDNYANIIGEISMNTCMIDVTDFPNVLPGDEVVLYGKEKNKHINRKEVKEITDMEIFELSVL